MCISVFASLSSLIARSMSSSVMFAATIVRGPVLSCVWLICVDPPGESVFWRLRSSFGRHRPSCTGFLRSNLLFPIVRCTASCDVHKSKWYIL